MDRDTSAAERDHQAHLKAQRARGSATRSTTASFSREETARRRNERNKADIEGQGAATATAATATKDQAKHKSIAILYGAEAAEVTKSKPQRLPDLVLEGPHEASLEFHQDWTRVQGCNSCPEKWELELRLRDSRNRLIWGNLTGGRSVFYKSSGDSMWPLVQSDDACTFHPIQAVTAKDGIQKEASEVGVGDIVFCQVQRSTTPRKMTCLLCWFREVVNSCLSGLVSFRSAS
jgi:hypothetical protein